MTHNPASSVRERGESAGPARPHIGAEELAELQGVRERRPEALGAFFERHFDWVYALLHRLLGETAAAEDAAQDVFLKVHRAAHTIDTGRDPRPWLRTIAYNVCRDVWRSGAYRMARRAAQLDGPPETAPVLPDPAPDPERQVLSGERARAVRGALASLPATLREMVILHDYENLPHDEIAKMIGIQPAAARKRYSRALAALAQKLQGVVS
jgi:RNA polymerase sigma-70 factor (ECF subfamily)